MEQDSPRRAEVAAMGYVAGRVARYKCLPNICKTGRGSAGRLSFLAVRTEASTMEGDRLCPQGQQPCGTTWSSSPSAMRDKGWLDQRAQPWAVYYRRDSRENGIF